MALMVILLILGVGLIGAEIFIPGGVVGALGGLAVLSSIIMAFTRQGTTFGMVWSLGAVFFTLLSLFGATRYVPRSRLGRKLLLETDQKGSSSSQEGLTALLGKAGTALTDLRPSGMAELESQRVDVVTGGEFITRGKTVEVYKVEGNRVVVREVKDGTP